jgi:hypothetical protein
MNASAAASMGFGIFSADASFQFASSGRFSKYNNYIFAQVRVSNATEMLKSYMLTEGALRRAERGIDQFIEMCGDDFVYARQTGGEMTAVIQFSSSSDDQQKQVRAQVDAAVAAFGSGQAKVSEALESLRKISESRIFVMRDGGVGSIPSLDSLVAAVRSFPERVRPDSFPVILAMLTLPYSKTDNLPSRLGSFETVRIQQQALAAYARLLQRAFQVRGEWMYVLEHPLEFPTIPRGDVEGAFDAVDLAVAGLQTAADECRANPKTACKVKAPQPLPVPPNRTGAGPEPPKPEPLPQWVSISVKGGETDLGLVKVARLKAVHFQGSWTPFHTKRGCYDASGKKVRSLPKELAEPPGMPFHAWISLRDAATGRELRREKFAGQPLFIDLADVRVVVSMNDIDSHGNNEHCAPPLEAKVQ